MLGTAKNTNLQINIFIHLYWKLDDKYKCRYTYHRIHPINLFYVWLLSELNIIIIKKAKLFKWFLFAHD